MNRNIYAHKWQKKFIAHKARTKVAICGRGWGKTTVDGIHSCQCVKALPKSRGFFLGLTYTQILTKFLPAILDFWERIGIKEHISNRELGHYVVGVKPPDYWQKPYAKIKRFTNVISFYNGSYIELLSMDRKDLNLGGSYDWGLVDEIQGINKDRFMKENFMTIRGNSHRYDSPLHHSLVLTGTMPWTSSGQWLLEYEEKAKEKPDEFFYLERPAMDNIDVLTPKYFADMEAELPAMMYDIEIKNERVKILSDGFYPEFNEEKHTYYAAYSYSDELPSIHSLTSYSPESTDYDPAKPIDISFDFGAKVTCMIIAQETDNELKIIDKFYSKSSDAVLSLTPTDSQMPLQRTVQQFLNVYRNHKAMIYIWGDHTGHNRTDKSLSSYQVVEGMLRTAKVLFVNKVEKTTNPFHAKKYQIINAILSGNHPNCAKVRINKNKCKELIISIQISPVDNDFQKDKRSERDPNLHIEKQTHFSDAFDYLVYNKYKQRIQLDGGGSGGASVGVGVLR